ADKRANALAWKPFRKSTFKLLTCCGELTLSGGPLVASAMKSGPVVLVPSTALNLVPVGGPCPQTTSTVAPTNIMHVNAAKARLRFIDSFLNANGERCFGKRLSAARVL